MKTIGIGVDIVKNKRIQLSINNKKLGIEASLSSIFNSSDYRPEHEPAIYANLSSYVISIERYMNKIFFEIEAYHNNDLNKD